VVTRCEFARVEQCRSCRRSARSSARAERVEYPRSRRAAERGAPRVEREAALVLRPGRTWQRPRDRRDHLALRASASSSSRSNSRSAAHRSQGPPHDPGRSSASEIPGAVCAVTAQPGIAVDRQRVVDDRQPHGEVSTSSAARERASRIRSMSVRVSGASAARCVPARSATLLAGNEGSNPSFSVSRGEAVQRRAGYPRPPRRGAGAAERGGLENR
jgi:hypothetical protein